MKVAAYQAPLPPDGSFDVLGLIRAQVEAREALGVAVLCCPEAILGGLADHAAEPHAVATDARDDLHRLLALLNSSTVNTIVGFTEAGGGALYNASAVYERGSVIGIYRKMHPAIRHSVYAAGDRTPVFWAGA